MAPRAGLLACFQSENQLCTQTGDSNQMIPGCIWNQMIWYLELLGVDRFGGHAELGKECPELARGQRFVRRLNPFAV
jgi:hypothetical protein